MKIQIRKYVFETNSSSVHSCSVATKDNYDLFINGEVWYKEEDDDYLPKDDAIEKNLEHIKLDLTDDELAIFKKEYKESGSLYKAYCKLNMGYYDIDPYGLYFSSTDYFDWREYETWSYEFKDTAGVDIIAWGYIGFD